MREVLMEYEEFKSRVDKDKPIHYMLDIDYSDKFKTEMTITLQMSGLDKNSDIIGTIRFVKVEVFEFTPKDDEETINDTIEQCVNELKTLYVYPLKATEGYYEG